MNSIPRPPALKAGDRVAVMSPAGAVLREHIELGLATLRDWGLEPDVYDQTFARNNYLAGTDDERAAALQRALDDPEIRAVFFSRGGYGCMRIIDRIDWSSLHGDTTKLIVGFSDITAFHLPVAARGVATLHAPVLKSYRLHAEDLPALRAAVFGESQSLAFPVDAVRDGTAEGQLTGGNLSIVASLLASNHCPSLAGRVLVLEDVGETDYRLDRLFTAIRMSEKARGIAAIVLGDFTECGGVYVAEGDIPAYVRDLAAEVGDALDCPVFAEFPTGHGSRCVPIPMGVGARIESSVLTFDSDVTG